MKITKKRIKELKPCIDAWEWYLKNQENDLLTLLLNVNKVNPSWARWLFTHLMTKKQNVQIAIFSAELVIHIFEKKYPDDKRPRKAIEAAKEYLKCHSKKNAAAAYAAAVNAAASATAAAANAAAYAAYAAYADAYAYDAVYAADAAAAYAANADADSVYAAYAAYAAAAADAAANAAAANAAAATAYAAAAYADAYAYDAAAILELQEKIIHEAVRILEESK